METGSTTPSPREARETLQQLAQDESAVRYPGLPWWFFITGAALMAAVLLTRLLPPSDARNATFALVIVAAVLGWRYWRGQAGVSWVTMKLGDMGWFLAALLGVGGVCLVVSEFTGAWWVWIVGAAVNAAIVLWTGHLYRREFGDGR